MALQNSGQISLGNIQAEFGGSNPISVSEYYRGGSYVPSTVSSTSTNTTYSANNDYYNEWTDRYNSSNGQFVSGDIRIGGTYHTCIAGNSYTVGSSTYSRYSYKGLYNPGNQSDPCGGPTFNQYRFYRYKKVTTVTNNTTVNTGIPSSGAASFSQYYGGTNS